MYNVVIRITTNMYLFLKTIYKCVCIYRYVKYKQQLTNKFLKKYNNVIHNVLCSIIVYYIIVYCIIPSVLYYVVLLDIVGCIMS